VFFFQRFINARRRIVQPMIDQSNRAGTFSRNQLNKSLTHKTKNYLETDVHLYPNVLIFYRITKLNLTFFSLFPAHVQKGRTPTYAPLCTCVYCIFFSANPIFIFCCFLSKMNIERIKSIKFCLFAWQLVFFSSSLRNLIEIIFDISIVWKWDWFVRENNLFNSSRHFNNCSSFSFLFAVKFNYLHECVK